MIIDGKILMLFAHPDDEIIFGWPVLQDNTLQKELLICSSDLNNPKRQKYSHRKEALFRLAHNLNIKCTCLDYDSEFYRLETRRESFSKMCAHVLTEINRINPDVQNYTRLMAYGIAGIGFLGSGIIIQNKNRVEGLTSAATLFAVVPIGYCIGLGFYLLGIMSAVFVYLILESKYKIRKRRKRNV